MPDPQATSEPRAAPRARVVAPIALPAISIAWVLGSLAGAARPAARLFFAGAAVGALGLALGSRRKLPLCAVAAAAAGGLAVASRLANPSAAPCHVGRHTGREVVRLWGEISGPPERTADGSRQLVAAHALERRTGERVRLCGSVELRRPAGAPLLHQGEGVLLRARLRRASTRRNPGLPSAALRMRAADVGAVAYVERIAVYRARGATVIGALRARLRGVVERYLPPGPGRGIVLALVLGDRDALSAEQRGRFSRAGLSHLLAVSGLHLSLVAIGLYSALRAALRRIPWLTARRDPRAIAAVGAAAAAVAFTALTGAAPATVRACTMSCALFLAAIIGRADDRARPLALAGLALSVAEPLIIFRPAFQLSFAAVLGILLALRRWERRPRPGTLAGRALWSGAGLLVTTTGATIVTAPLVAHHFGVVSLVAVPANLVAVPLTSFLLLPLALAGTLLCSVLPMVGAWPLRAAGYLAERLDGFASAVGDASVSAATVQLSWLPTLALLGLAVALLLRRGRARRAVALCAALVLLGCLAARALTPSRLQLAFLDVGQGDATFVRLPDGRALLVDAGGTPGTKGDPGRRVVLPFLRRQGVERLELVVATHPHADHVGGLTAVIEGVEVGELWACWHDEPSPLHDALLAAARRRGVPVRAPRVWVRGGVTVRPLWPAGEGARCADPTRSTNDNSIVLRLEHGRGSALLSGDIEADADAELLARGAPLAASVLKVAHHGSARSSTPALLLAVRPRLAVISCGAENAFGLPHALVLRRLRATGAALARTDELGAVVAELSADGGLSWHAGHRLLP